MNHDEINNPAHYQLFPDVEAIDVIKAALTPAEFIGYLKGSALKYRLRAGDKGPAAKCIGKAHWYQNYLWNVMEYLKPDRADLGDFGQQNVIDPTVKDSLTVEPVKKFDISGGVMMVGNFLEPASEIDDDSPRRQAIDQNGNDGLHYKHQEPLKSYSCLICNRTFSNESQFLAQPCNGRGLIQPADARKICLGSKLGWR